MTAKFGKGIFVANTLPTRKRRLLAFMREHPIGVVCSVTPDGDPHGVVVYYTVDENLTVRFLTKVRTRKYDNLKHNSHLMLVVFDARTQTTLTLTGVAVEYAGLDAIHEVARAVFTVPQTTSDNGPPPIAKLVAGAYTTFMIEPAQIRMAAYGRPQTGDYDELFESVESFELSGV